MSSINTNLSLTEVHKELSSIIIPIVSMIAILMFIGVIGNAAVIYIYGFILKNTVVHYFITVLAVFDFVSCLFGFPMEIIEFYYYMNYPSTGLCKWQRYITFGCSIGSIIVLLIISIERYRNVCRSTSYQLNLQHARYFAIAACILSVLLASPMTVFAQNKQVKLKRFENVTGCDCRLSNKYGNGPMIYFIFLLVLITVILVTMLSLYVLLWRTARMHLLRSDSRFQQSVNNDEMGSSPAKRHMSRTNRTVILVTVLFAVSFFPTIILSIFADVLMRDMNYTEEIVFFMGVRMYIFNCSFNPIVYGFCNKYFRNAFVQLVRKMFCSSVEIPTISTETS